MLDKQTGSGMIEILVSLIVLAIGLLGIAGMQVISMKNANNAEHRYRASMIAYDMMERMRSNPAGVSTNEYNNVNISSSGSSDSSASTCSAVCSASELAAYDVAMWEQKITALPNGTASVTGNAAVFEITVAWQEQNTNKDSSPEASDLLANEYTLEFEL